MSTRFSLAAASAALMVAGALNAVPGVVYNDAANDIDPGITTGGGTLDLLSMEVSHTATDIVFSLTVNGSVNSVDWGKFMIGISTPGGDKTTTGNGWSRPINFASNGGMNYWVGSWVDSGGGSQLWSNGASGWSGPASNAGFSFSGNNITYTISRAAIGMSGDGTFFFDAYSSGGYGGDSAVDALSVNTPSISNWAGPFTTTNAFSYTIPAPGAIALVALAGVAARRRKA
jgi:hypothetical protein